MTSSKVTIEPLDIHNLDVWRPRMEAFIIQQKAWAAIKPIPALAPAGSNAATAEAAVAARDATMIASEAANDMARACIVLHVANHHLADCEAQPNARLLWHHLLTKLRSSDPARQHVMQQEFASFRLGPTEPITLYVDRATALKNALAGVGIAKSDLEIIWMMFNGLPARFTNLIESLQSAGMVTPLTLAGVQSRLISSEQRENMLAGHSAYGQDEHSALYGGRGAGHGTGRGTGRGPNRLAPGSANRGSGAWSTQASAGRGSGAGTSSGSPAPGPTCWTCGAQGHKAFNCPKGRPQGGGSKPQGGGRPKGQFKPKPSTTFVVGEHTQGVLATSGANGSGLGVGNVPSVAFIAHMGPEWIFRHRGAGAHQQ
jgi:hypothetical protein